MLKKLRLKFVFFIMFPVTILLFGILSFMYHVTRMSLERESILMMQTIAANPMRRGAPDEPDTEVRLPYFTVQISPDGELITTDDGYYDLSDQTFIRELVHTASQSNNRTGVIREYHLRYLREKVPGRGMQCIVFSDISSEQNTLRNLLRTCLLIGVLSFLAFFIISIYLARWAVRPVELAWEEQRRFVGDASHELKTPLTVILTNAEMLQSEEFDENHRRQFSDNILTMSHQMQGLVEGLLDLARTDQGAENTSFCRLDLSRLLQDALLPFEPVFFEKGLTLELRLADGVYINGSAAHLEKLIAILADNAAKYSSPGGKTTVALNYTGARSCLLSVSNPGETILPQDMKNIFKRFYRADTARSMNRSYGLGLSIAENIVLEHKGKIWCESQENVNTFWVKLPALPREALKKG